MKQFLHFWCLEVLPVYLQREVKPHIIWFYPPWLYYDVSLHKVVELVVVIPTSLRSSKMESGCSSYCCFYFGISIVSERPKIASQGPEIFGLTGRPALSRPVSGCLSVLVWIFAQK
jgi:hypothetical protein